MTGKVKKEIFPREDFSNISRTGIGLSWSGPWATNIDATFSRRIGKNPNQTMELTKM